MTTSVVESTVKFVRPPTDVMFGWAGVAKVPIKLVLVICCNPEIALPVTRTDPVPTVNSIILATLAVKLV